MLLNLKSKIRAFFSNYQDIFKWYCNFASEYDKMAWQIEIILSAKAREAGVIKRNEAYPAEFIQKVMNSKLYKQFKSMRPKFAGAGRKKAVYGFGKTAVVKLALKRNALAGDLLAYKRFSHVSCLPKLYGVSENKTSMLCEYAPPPDEKWFVSNFGIPHIRICALLEGETAGNIKEKDFVNKIKTPDWTALREMQNMIMSGLVGKDAIENEENWGLARRSCKTVPVLIDCGY